METIKLKDIVPDEAQPRKYFDATKLKLLADSIKREGIITPLIVEKVGDKFLLVDGERRYRAAQQIGLEKVPVVIEEPKKAIERLVRQFTVQEQHEGWTPIEKAVALTKLSEEMGLTLRATCRLLNIGEGDTARYAAFSQLADKEAWVRSETPLDYAHHMSYLKNSARKVFETEFEEDFTRSDEKKLERRVIEGIKDGVINRRGDMARLSYSFQQDPKSLKKFMDTKISPAKLFIETGASETRALKRVLYECGFITKYGKEVLGAKNIKLSEAQIHTFKAAKKVIDQLASLEA